MTCKIKSCCSCEKLFAYGNEDVQITPPCIELERYVICPFCKAYNKL